MHFLSIGEMAHHAQPARGPRGVDVMSRAADVRREGGEPRLSEETTGIGFFSPHEIETMDLMETHRERLADALSGAQAAIWE